ncbi:MAG: hypothetical protein K2X86_15370, partial [Cytophagaceae bacterium]|nr:hypothetical protein [Cytophagaceae bacterium]
MKKVTKFLLYCFLIGIGTFNFHKVTAQCFDPTVTININPTQNPCYGVSLGSIRVTIGGGMAPYTYALYSDTIPDRSTTIAANTYTFTNLPPGTYLVAVQVTKPIGFTFCTQNVIITSPPPININGAATPASCNGASNGNVNINISGGTGPYNFIWNNGSSTEDLSNVPAGSYSVNVTDANGCPASSGPFVVGQPPAVPANAGPDAIICAGSSTNLSASGGVTYSWAPAAGLSNPNIANPVATPAATTTYTVTVTDGAGCSNTDNVTITVNPLPLANAGPDASVCAGSSTNLSASGGVTYSWAPAAGLSDPNIANPVATPAATTTYTVTVTDANGCVNTDNVIITVNPLPVADAGPDVTICVGSSTNLSASGGITYSWSPAAGLSNPNISNPVASPIVTTTYTVAVIDGNGCVDTDDVIVTANEPTADAGSDVTICEGTGTILNGSGGTTYSWAPGGSLSNPNISNPVASPVTTTTYTLTVTDLMGCTGDAQVTIFVNPAPIANAGPDAAMCFGASINLSASGGGTYSWAPAGSLSDPNIANPVATPVATTTYTVTVTDGNGCQKTDDVVITVNPLPTADAGVDATVCAGLSTNLSASGGTTYSWAPGATLSNP